MRLLPVPSTEPGVKEGPAAPPLVATSSLPDFTMEIVSKPRLLGLPEPRLPPHTLVSMVKTRPGEKFLSESALAQVTQERKTAGAASLSEPRSLQLLAHSGKEDSGLWRP